jgi:hypothetical protein
VLFTELHLREGSSLQIHKAGRKVGCFHVVASSSKHITDEPELSSDFLKLSSEVSVMVIIAPVAINFGDDGPVVEVVGGFAEGMKCGSGTSEEVMEPGQHGLGDFFVEVVGGENEVDSEGLLIMVLTNKEADAAVRVELDPLGIGIVTVSDRDLGRDSPIVVLVTNGSKGKLKFSVRLL